MTLAFAPLDGALNALVGMDSELPCRQYDPDLWFADVPADLEVAKTLCGPCPLKVESRGRPRKEDLARDAVLLVEVANRTNLLMADRKVA
jgi:WhiB family redox-sensing transcriptional regulator